MKILQIIQRPQLRGAEIFACQLSTHLAQQGYEVVIVHLFDGEVRLPFNGKIRGVHANEKRKLVDFYGWKRLSQIIREENPTIIQANAGDTLKYAVFSKLLFKWNQPIIVRNASIVSSYITSFIQRKYNEFLYKFVYKVISVSEQSRQDIIKIYPSLNGKTLTIPIGINEVELSEFINPFGEFEGKINIVHIGGFTFEKNHKALLRIFSEISRENPDLHLWLLGDGPLRVEIENLISKISNRDRIHILGFVDNAQAYAAYADCLVLPSIIEGLPAVILEAMAYKTPVVAYDVGGIKEIVRNGETGWLIDRDDEASFGRAIINAINTNKLNNKIVNAAFNLVKSQYSNSTIAEEFKLIYSYCKVN